MSAIRPHSNRIAAAPRALDLVRRAVAADHDLLLRVVQRVERVEELRLRALLAGDELDVVHEQHVHAPIALTKIEDAVVTHRVDHLVHEALGRDVGELQVPVVIEDVVPDGVHQMRLAESHAAVDEQRVVGARRRLGHRSGSGMRELIRRADDEGVERVARRETARLGHALRTSGSRESARASAGSVLGGDSSRR